MRYVRSTLWAVAALVALAACARSTAVPFDQQFIDMMVPHHQGAVEMARMAQQRAQKPEIKAMAADIITAQDAEIARMKGWRKAWFGSDQTPPMDKMPMVEGMTSAAHGGHGPGTTMDMAADVESLRKAGELFDRAFIDAMIPHHESAIDAAKAAATRAQKSEVKKLAADIEIAQKREIAQMREWRRAWYGS